METISSPLSLDPATLRDPVRRLLGNATAEVATWGVRPLGQASAEATGGVYRVQGTASDRGELIRWSLVLKVCRNPDSSDRVDPRAVFYWKREFLANNSGLLDELPPGVRAARCYGAEERLDGTAWLWLEDLTDTYGSSWPLQRYGLAARHAGQFNGAYLGGWPLPTVP